MVNRYVYGAEVLLTATFAAAPPSVALSVRPPSGALRSPTVDPIQAPTYRAIVTADVIGTWNYRFEGSDGAVREDSFEVVESAVLAPAEPRYTYDPTTLIGQVRLLTDDRDLSSVALSTPLEQRSAVWADEELQVFLNDNGQNTLLAAAQALTVLAVNRQLLVQSRRIGQTAVSFGGVRSDLLAQAKAYREQALTADGPARQFAEIAYNDFGARRIIENDMLRNG